MALLDNSVITGVATQTVAAYLPQHLVRLGELQSLLANYQQVGSGVNPGQISGLVNFIDATVASLLQNTTSIDWTYNSGTPSLMASVALAPGGFLGVNSQGLFVQVGSGSNQVAPGNVMPSGLPILPVTLLSGGTVTVGAFNGRAIPANFQSGTPLRSVSFEVTSVPFGGVLSTPSGVQADFGPAYTQVARGADLLALANTVTELEDTQITTLSTASVLLSLIASPGQANGATSPMLFERAGEVMPGDQVGGQYELDYAVTVERVAVMALAPQVRTVLELMLGGVGTGLTLTIPSGVPNTMASAFMDPALPSVQIPLTVSGRTAPITWQCISGSSSVVEAISQVDLVMYAQSVATAVPAGAGTPILFERAGQVLPGDQVGGQYELDYGMQVERVAIMAMAAAANTTFELMAGGVGTGLSITVPSGLPNTMVTAFLNPAFPTTQIPVRSNGRTLPLTWQCTNGSSSVITAISQVDLIMYAVALTGGSVTTSGNRLSASVLLEPGGGLQTTGSGVGVIYGDFVAEDSPPGTVAPGNHTHNFPQMSTLSTPSLMLSVSPPAGSGQPQQIIGDVNLDPDPPFGYGQIAVDVNGLAVVLGTASDVAAAGNHTHQAVSPSGSGFMTPAMLVELQGSTNSMGQVATYYRSSNCPVSGFIGAGLRWPQAMQIIGANVVAQTPPQYNQVLSLVVGGVTQALSITIPSGVPNVDVFASLDNLSTVIPMESSSGLWTSYARWQCTSGTGPLIDLAAQVTVAMNVVPV